MKSSAHTALITWVAINGCLGLFGSRRLVRRFWFSLIWQYTLCTRLWFHGLPIWRSRSKHFQNPHRSSFATISLSASITSRSRAPRSRSGL
mgnify:CR=1 FL=1